MEEKEYLLTKSIHPRHDDQNIDKMSTSNYPSFPIVDQISSFSNVDQISSSSNVDQFSLSKPFSNVVNLTDADEDEESGVFCVSSVFQKSDPTTSLSYWMGKLLTEKMLEGKN